MTAIGVGVAALALLLLAATLFVSVDPRSLVKSIRYGLGGLLVGAGGLLVVSRLVIPGLILAGIGLSAISLGRIGPLDLGGGRRTAGSISTVRSAFLEMRLDHDTGAIEGRVISGAFSGRILDELDDDDLLSLAREVAADGDSIALLEGYLDRRMPGWREHVEADAATGTRRAADTGPMTDEQAYEILGLAPGAGKAEIRAAHRRLMKRVHPDQGGSTFLAAKINQAKDWLLGRHR
jgi:hypothetical protein